MGFSNEAVIPFFAIIVWMICIFQAMVEAQSTKAPGTKLVLVVSIIAAFLTLITLVADLPLDVIPLAMVVMAAGVSTVFFFYLVFSQGPRKKEAIAYTGIALTSTVGAIIYAVSVATHAVN